MKKCLLALSLLAAITTQAQKTPPANDFEARFTALFDFVTAETPADEGKKTGFIGAESGGLYAVKKGLPGAKDEQLMLVNGTQHWIYRSELGRYKAGQEAAEKAQEEKLSQLMLAKITAAGWTEVKRITSSAQFRTVLHYRNSDGTHNLRLKVMKNSKNEEVIQLYLE